MPVYRDKRSGHWRYRKLVKLPDGSSKRVSGTPSLNTKRAAEQAERAHIERVLTGQDEKPKTWPTVKALIDKWESTYVDTHLGPASASNVRSMMRNHIAPAIGDVRIDKLTASKLEECQAALAKKLAPSTVNLNMRWVRSFLSWVERQGYVQSIPRAKPLKEGVDRFDFLEFEEADALLTGAKNVDHQTYTLILCALDTGMRRGELRGLQWSDVDFRRGQIVVNHNAWENNLQSPKSGKSRVIPMTNRLTRALKAHRHLRGPDVFSTDKGTRLSNARLVTMVRQAQRAGAARTELTIRPHALRHTFASHLAMRGVPLRVIQSLMGHSSILLTQRYAHLSPRSTVDAIRALESGRPTDWQHRGNASEDTAK